MIIEDIFDLTVPRFSPNYDRKKRYGYNKKTKMREELKNLLYRTSYGYCMYCFTRIVIDKKDYGHLEHSIEKSCDEGKILERCVLNISIVCPTCNNKFKKQGEKERIEFLKKTDEFRKFTKINCTAPKCYEMCEEYRELRKKLFEHKQGHILLQPLSRGNPENLHPLTNNELKVIYDLLKGEFVPNKKHRTELVEHDFVVDHINMFRLNDINYRTNEIYRFCKDFINGKISEINLNYYNNLMVDKFILQIEGYSDPTKKKICELIYLRGLILGRNMD